MSAREDDEWQALKLTPVFGLIAGLAGGFGMRWISGFAAGCVFCVLYDQFRKIPWPKG